jgi:hypothetical protein
MTVPVLAVIAVLGVGTVALGSARVVDPFGEDLESGLEAGPDASTPAAGTTVPAGTTAPATTVSGVGGGQGAAAAPPATTQPPGVPPSTVTVVGDSVGMTLVRNAPASAEQQIRITDGSIEGCGIVEGTVKTAARGFRWSFNGCEGWPERWAANVQESGAQVALVIIGAWDVFDLGQGDRVVAFGTPEFDQHFRTQLRRGIDALKSVGVKVALLEVPCYRPISAGGLRALPERGDDNRTRHLNEMLRQAAAADPGNVRFVTGPQEYCTNQELATDVGHRWDGVHYYKPGAELVWSTIVPQLLAIRV